MAPTGLSAQWRATSARFEGDENDTTWFLGYVTPEDQYVALAQTDGDASEFIADQTLQGQSDGERSVSAKKINS